MISPWFFENSEINELPDCVGFIYEITNLTNDRKYIGKKLKYFSKTSIKTVTLKSGLKKKKKVKKLVESDWKKYWSSCLELQEDVKKLGEENFKREILCFCDSKGKLSLAEAQEQINNRVLFSDKYYNKIINLKVHQIHIKGN